MISNKKVLFLEQFHNSTIEALEEYDYEVVNFQEFNPEICPQVTAIFAKVSHGMTEEFLSKFVNLKYIVTPSTGTDMIPYKVKDLSDIKILSLRDDPKTLQSFYSTREVFLWLLISLLRNTHRGAIAVESGFWDRTQHIGTNLAGKKIGIIGIGRIGNHIASVCTSLGMKVFAYDLEQKSNLDKDITLLSSAEELVSKVEIVSINVDDRKANSNMFNSKLLEKANQQGIFVINTSRGLVIDEEAIVTGFKDGKLRGFASDVLKGEGSEGDWLEDNPIWKFKNSNPEINIILTPHLGGATHENILLAEKSVLNLFLRNEGKLL